MAETRNKVVLFSPSRAAVGGVSTHVRMMFESDLARDFELLHLQVGSDGRRENALQKLARSLLSPLNLALFLIRPAERVHHCREHRQIRPRADRDQP
jgi:hypothetical protein